MQKHKTKLFENLAYGKSKEKGYSISNQLIEISSHLCVQSFRFYTLSICENFSHRNFAVDGKPSG